MEIPAELTHDDVQRVINRIKEKGWTKGIYGGHSGPNCIIGHIRLCFEYPTLGLALFSPLAEKLTRKLDLDLVRWNDARGTTQDKVVALLEKVRDECKT